MEYILSKKYEPLISSKIMGPNPVKLTEELMRYSHLEQRDRIIDLGSGQGITSVFLAKEYGFYVYACDLWSDPSENMRFFKSVGLSSGDIMPIHADANALPFAHEYFDGVMCTDSYNYFGRDESYLSEKLLPFVKHGGWVYICVPGMKKDCHDNLPEELLVSWSPEQLNYIHDVVYWKRLLEKSEGLASLEVFEMESNEEVWNDWLACDNEYAVNDRKAFEAGGGRFLNFIGIVLQKK